MPITFSAPDTKKSQETQSIQNAPIASEKQTTDIQSISEQLRQQLKGSQRTNSASVVKQCKEFLKLNSPEAETQLIDILFENLEHIYADYVFRRMYTSSIYPLYPQNYRYLLAPKHVERFIELYPNAKKKVEICQKKLDSNKQITIFSLGGKETPLERVEDQRNGYKLIDEPPVLSLPTVSLVIGIFPDPQLKSPIYSLLSHQPLESFPSPDKYNELIVNYTFSYRSSGMEKDNEPKRVKVIQVTSETWKYISES